MRDYRWTRARNNVEKQIDPSRGLHGQQDQDDSEREGNYFSEKQAVVNRPEASSNSTSSTGTAVVDRGTSIAVLPVESSESVPMPKVRRTCGVRRRNFWVICSVVLTVVIAAAVIGGAVGGTRPHSSSSSSAIPSTNFTEDNGPLNHANIIIGSPLTVMSYAEKVGNSSMGQTFRMYFQSAVGNIKETSSIKPGFWRPTEPIFTDALNNTGLASITYLNKSDQMGSIFYVGNHGFLFDKRKVLKSQDDWLPGSLGATPYYPAKAKEDNDSEYGWDNYRLTAVYSKNFHSGPGGRLFYHAENVNRSSNLVNELIWYQNNDSWAEGDSFSADPHSHLSATVDESTHILRLFYSTGGKALEYSWLNISDPEARYRKGLHIENVLVNSSADIAAVSNNGSTYVYHYVLPPVGNPGIHELNITGQPGLDDNSESFNMTGLVVSPNLRTQYGSSPYQPLTVSQTAGDNNTEAQLYVFWADKMTGSSNFSFATSNTKSGYSQLWGLSRSVTKAGWPNDSSKIPIGLGDKDSPPHSRP